MDDQMNHILPTLQDEQAVIDEEIYQDTVVPAGEGITIQESTEIVVPEQKEEKIYHYDEIPHGVSLVRERPKFSLGGENKIGVTRKVKVETKHKKKIEEKSAKTNRNKHRHHVTKKEHKARKI